MEDTGGRPGKLIQSLGIFTSYYCRIEPERDFVLVYALSGRIRHELKSAKCNPARPCRELIAFL